MLCRTSGGFRDWNWVKNVFVTLRRPLQKNNNNRNLRSLTGCGPSELSVCLEQNASLSIALPEVTS